jgi:hypothetical protein
MIVVGIAIITQISAFDPEAYDRPNPITITRSALPVTMIDDIFCRNIISQPHPIRRTIED